MARKDWVTVFQPEKQLENTIAALKSNHCLGWEGLQNRLSRARQLTGREREVEIVTILARANRLKRECDLDGRYS